MLLASTLWSRNSLKWALPSSRETPGVLPPLAVTSSIGRAGDPVCLLASTTWIWLGELTAQGNEVESLIDQPVWAIYFPSIEQPMLGPPGGTVMSDWFVFVDVNTENVVLATSLTTTGAASSEGRVDGPVLTSPPPPSGERAGMGAQVMGTVLLDDRGCLVLELEGVRYAVLWPAGTSWQPDLAAVVLPDGQIVEPGMSVLGGGGYLSSVAHMTGQEVNDAAAECAGPTGEIAIFNLGSEVAITGG